MNIVLLEPLGIPDEALNALAAPLIAAGHSFVAHPLTHFDAETVKQACEADIVMLANKRLDGDVIRQLPNLKFISVAFTGVDHIGLDACKERGIAVSNAAGYATDSVAELAMCMMIACLRNVLPCDQRCREGGTKDGLVGTTLRGKTVGIVGTGAIGLRVAELLKPFGCRLVASSRTEKQQAKDLGVNYLPLDELMAVSDIVTLHVPLTEATRNLIDARRIKLMKQNAILVNTARGPVVDATALSIALRDRKIAGAAVDVFEKEPPIYPAHPLLNAPNVLVTPHIAYATEESMVERAKIAFENVSSWIAGNQINKVL
ncbi:MAG: NAD(P)-dependent oxidoreductase [Christensenellales bacterium]|jgi:phosphoglycerate dehydrogenase-like enzyme